MAVRKIGQYGNPCKEADRESLAPCRLIEIGQEAKGFQFNSCVCGQCGLKFRGHEAKAQP